MACLDWFHLRCSFHRSTHCRKDHPELLPYFHISTKLITSPSTACGFERHQSRTYICRISRGGRKARRSCERADRPRKTSALYFPLHPRRHIMSRRWRRVLPGGRARTLPWMCRRPQPASSLTGHIKDSVSQPLAVLASRSLLMPHSSSIHQSLSSSLSPSLPVLPQSGSVRDFPSGNWSFVSGRGRRPLGVWLGGDSGVVFLQVRR